MKASTGPHSALSPRKNRESAAAQHELRSLPAGRLSTQDLWTRRSKPLTSVFAQAALTEQVSEFAAGLYAAFRYIFPDRYARRPTAAAQAPGGSLSVQRC